MGVLQPGSVTVPPADGFVAVFVIGLYLLPSVVAVARGCVFATRVMRVNLLLGWTVIGWFAALVAAVRNPPRRRWLL
jgi:hypothetical protein